jgi:hypothetical protein
MSKKNEQLGENAASISEAEWERIKRDVYRPDIEKLRLFTNMLRQNDLFKKAKITHK